MNDLFPLIKDINSKKKAWLDYLFYKIGKQAYNFKICAVEKDEQGNSIPKSKWLTYFEAVASLDINENWKLKKYNQRQILPNEVIIDLEDKKNLKDIILKLKESKLTFYIFDTHSRGVHINIFYNKKLSKIRKEVLIKYFQGDLSKSGDMTMIALEFCPHWKSGEIKDLVEYHV
jgi:hypothetical protein